VLRVASEPAFRQAAALVGARMRAHRVTPVQRAAGAPQTMDGPMTRPARAPGALWLRAWQDATAHGGGAKFLAKQPFLRPSAAARAGNAALRPCQTQHCYA